MGAVSGQGVVASVADALSDAGLTQAYMVRTVSTGYGRRMLDIAEKNYTEITCHARGAVAMVPEARLVIDIGGQDSKVIAVDANDFRSEEHTSELQSLMRISYAVFCLKKKKKIKNIPLHKQMKKYHKLSNKHNTYSPNQNTTKTKT